MSRWEVQRSLWPFLDKLEKLKIFGSSREEVVNTLLSMEIAHLIGMGVIDVKLKRRRRWFLKLKR